MRRARLIGIQGDLDLEKEVDLGEVIRRIVDEVADGLDADRATLYLIDRARGEVVSRAAHLPEIGEIRLRLGEGVAGWVAETGRLVNVPRGTTDPRFTGRIDEETGYQTRSLLAVPIRDAGGIVVGVLQAVNKRAGDFLENDETHLCALASRVSDLLGSTSLASQLRPDNCRTLSYHFNNIVGDSPVMRDVFERTARAARTAATVLIRGESGSGKDAIARAVHYNSPRRARAFVKVDCAALPESLIENELFGHERGAYTGADGTSDGKVAVADGGTLFLDEIGEIPLHVQGKLLRVLQERAFLRVGGTTPIIVDVRFVCATHCDLERAVAERRFRQDLYYRLRVVEIAVPPLCARGPADLDRLIDHFFCKLTALHERPDLRLSESARRRLHGYAWPGNVRELMNCIESAVVLAPGSTIADEHLPLRGHTAELPGASTDAFSSRLVPLDELERAYVEHVLRHCGGNRTAAARMLGIGRNTLLRKLRGGSR